MPNIENKLFDTWHSVSAIVSPTPFFAICDLIVWRVSLYCDCIVYPRPVSSVLFFYVPGRTKFPTAIVSKYRWPAKWKLRAQCHANRRHLWAWQATTSSSYPISYPRSRDSWLPENIRLYIYVRCENDNHYLYNGFTQANRSEWKINIIPDINIVISISFYL